MEVEFDLSGSKESVDSHKIITYKWKEKHLVIIHKWLGHLSFTTLRLLAYVGLIPKELADVDSPVCPGCAYRKAHRIPCQWEGIKIKRRSDKLQFQGKVVSVCFHSYRETNYKEVHCPNNICWPFLSQMNAEATVEAKLVFEQFSPSLYCFYTF